MNIEKKQVETGLYIIAALAVVVIGFLIIKKALQTVGVIRTDEEAAAAKTTEKAIEQFSKDAAKTSKATKTPAQWTFVANNIYNALKHSAASDDKTLAYTELARILTDADMSLVISAFGKRQEYAFGLPIGPVKTLPEFVKDNFAQSDIDSLNNLYSKSKMKWRF